MPPDAVTWDEVLALWQNLCREAGLRRRRARNTQLWETLLQIRIILRGGITTQLIRECLASLQARYHRLLLVESAASTAHRARYGGPVTPGVVRWAHQTWVTDRASPNVPEGSPSAAGNIENEVTRLTRFANYFTHHTKTRTRSQHNTRFLPDFHKCIPEWEWIFTSCPTVRKFDGY
ncbi:unnamed protein product [Ixodes pacificus]